MFSPMSRSILFISHDASRTGAPMVLLHFLRWFKAHSNVPFQILLKEDGPLASEFRLLAPTTVYSQLTYGVPRNLVQRVFRKTGLAYQADYRYNPLMALYKPGEVSLVYSNTITNGNLLTALSHLDCPVITHVHELDFTIELNGRENLERVLVCTQAYIACAGVVQANLNEKYGISASKINIVHECVPDPPAGAVPRCDAIRRAYGWNEDYYVVGGSGLGGWRKGRDLFIQVALHALRTWPAGMPFRFLWVGNTGGAEDQLQIAYELRRAGLEGHVRFTGEVDNPQDYFAAIDAFALTSREDPFPLVCLEAAMLGKPIVCFADAGGMPEFVEDDCGFVVPYLDITAVADKLLLLGQDTGLRERLGRQAARKVRERHSVQVTAPRIARLIEETMRAKEFAPCRD